MLPLASFLLSFIHSFCFAFTVAFVSCPLFIASLSSLLWCLVLFVPLFHLFHFAIQFQFHLNWWQKIWSLLPASIRSHCVENDPVLTWKSCRRTKPNFKCESIFQDLLKAETTSRFSSRRRSMSDPRETSRDTFISRDQNLHSTCQSKMFRFFENFFGFSFFWEKQIRDLNFISRSAQIQKKQKIKSADSFS